MTIFTGLCRSKLIEIKPMSQDAWELSLGTSSGIITVRTQRKVACMEGKDSGTAHWKLLQNDATWIGKVSRTTLPPPMTSQMVREARNLRLLREATKCD